MPNEQQSVLDLRRMIRWIALAGVLMVAGSLFYLYLMDAWSTHAIVATILGVFVSVMLGCGLFALAFYSDKSGHDEDVSHTTSKQDNKTDDLHGTD